MCLKATGSDHLSEVTTSSKRSGQEIYSIFGEATQSKNVIRSDSSDIASMFASVDSAKCFSSKGRKANSPKPKAPNKGTKRKREGAAAEQKVWASRCSTNSISQRRRLLLLLYSRKPISSSLQQTRDSTHRFRDSLPRPSVPFFLLQTVSLN